MKMKLGSFAMSLVAVLGLVSLVGLGGCSSDDSDDGGKVVTYNVSLTGAQEVPPVATAATGSGSFTIDTGNGSVTGSVSFSGLSTPSTGAHIHQAPAGVNGPVAVPLAGGAGLTAGTYTVPAGSALTAAQIEALKVNGLYVNIHSTRYPGGEIRAQITTPPGVTY